MTIIEWLILQPFQFRWLISVIEDTPPTKRNDVGVRQLEWLGVTGKVVNVGFSVSERC